MSGRQLFGIDEFRDTGKPLVAVLADPKSIFMAGLARFQRRTLYTNIVNDRSAVHYTTGITKTDPYVDMSKIKTNPLPGYDGVILDPKNPVSPDAPRDPEPLMQSVEKWAKRVPIIATIVVFVPVALLAFFTNAAIQTVRSSQRVKLHESGMAGIKIEGYRVNLWIKEMREAVEDTYENINNSQNQQYLGLSEDDDDNSSEDRHLLSLERKQSHPHFPTLALAPYQFSAIQALDKLGWRKYPVWIHNARHSHAAIIVRMDKKGFEEGWVVLRHWARDEFLA